MKGAFFTFYNAQLSSLPITRESRSYFQVLLQVIILKYFKNKLKFKARFVSTGYSHKFISVLANTKFHWMQNIDFMLFSY